MKNPETVTNLNEAAVEFSPVLKQNFRTVRESLVDTNFIIRVMPEEMGTLLGNRMVLGNRGSVPLLVKAATEAAFFKIPRPLTWKDGIMKVRWFYSGSVSSTNFNYFQVTIDARGTSSVYHPAASQTSVYTAGGANYQIAGPATAYTELTWEPTETCLVDASCDIIQSRFLRSGTDVNDTYAGDTPVLGAELRYYPRRSQG